MAGKVDVVGHFGTTFSYATVGARVAAELRAHGLLGTVLNLDERWHEAHEHLRAPAGSGTHILLFTPPNHYIDTFFHGYGRERSALFMSPNTSTLSREHAETASQCGLLLAPSLWCESVTRRHVPDSEVEVVPLGADRSYAESRAWRAETLLARVSASRVTKVLHFSTDQWWPGRKGSQELLQAWALLAKAPGPVSQGMARLTLHVPPSLLGDATHLSRQLEIDETVDIVVGTTHGGSDADLREVIDAHDLLVAPSRCEGFGIMFLTALVAGLPLVGTFGTGQQDFMADSTGWLGIPMAREGWLAGEEGTAPIVEPRAIANSLGAALCPEALAWLIRSGAQHNDRRWGTWDSALPEWMNTIKEWMS